MMDKWTSTQEFIKSLDDVPIESTWLDGVPLFGFGDYNGQFIEVRLYPIKPFYAKHHWIKYDVQALGQKTRGKGFEFFCPDYNMITRTTTPKRCPVCLRYSGRDLLGPGKVMLYAHGYVMPPVRRGKQSWSNEPQPLRFPRSVWQQIKLIETRTGNSPRNSSQGCSIAITYDRALRGDVMWTCLMNYPIPIWEVDKRWKTREIIDFRGIFQPGNPLELQRFLKKMRYPETR